MARRLLLVATVVSAVAVPAFTSLWSSSAAASSGATVDVAINANLGTILTNAQGLALYTLPSDHNGISSCTGSCVQVWPALTVPSGTTPTGGPGVPGTLAAVLQPNGTFQVTYNGSPLYTFVGDSSPGQVTGNGVGGFSVVRVSAATPTPTSTPPSTPTPTPTSAPSTPTSPSTASTSPPTLPSAAGPALSPASSPGAVSPGIPSSLAFTGPGAALTWLAIVGAGLIVIGSSMFVVVSDRSPLRRRSLRKASRAG